MAIDALETMETNGISQLLVEEQWYICRSGSFTRFNKRRHYIMAKLKEINEMSFLDHLEDLRWHLIRILLGNAVVRR